MYDKFHKNERLNPVVSDCCSKTKITHRPIRGRCLSACAQSTDSVYKIWQRVSWCTSVWVTWCKWVIGVGSSVGREADYGLDGLGSNPGGERDFPAVFTGPGACAASWKMGTGTFTLVSCGRGLLLTTHKFLVPRSWKSRAIPLPTISATPCL